jgi:hypothetical protein
MRLEDTCDWYFQTVRGGLSKEGEPESNFVEEGIYV